MRIREWINSNQKASLGIAIAVSLLAVIYAAWILRGESYPDSPTVAFYSIDDGATFFTDEPGKLAFTKDGRPAVMAHVFEDPARGQFVGYLERLTPDAEKAALLTRANASDVPSAAAAAALGREVKRPGEAVWVSPESESGMRVMSVLTSDGKQDAIRVEPR